MYNVWEKFKHHFIPSHHNAYRPHILRRPWLLFFFATTLAVEGFLVANLVVRQSSEVFLAAVVPGELIALTNDERTNDNLPAVKKNQLLTNAAQAKAEDMAAKGYFSHLGPDGKEPWSWITAAGYDYRFAGENLAVRFVDSSDVVKAWMASPSHRDNIVKPNYTEIGVGVANGVYQGQPATYVVQYFASPQVVSVQPTLAASAGSALQAQIRTTLDGLQRQLTRVVSDPGAATTWALGVIATLLIVAITFAFFLHIQVQPTDMIASGALLAIFALSLIVVNTHFLKFAGKGVDAGQATALSALDLWVSGPVVIDNKASSIERQ
jgi:hypothetical protein